MTIPNKKGVKSTAQGTARIPARCSSWPEGWISSLAALRWERCERATLLVLMKVPGVLMEGQQCHTQVNVQILNPENKNLGCVCVCMQVYVHMYVWMYDYVIIFKYVCACLWVYMFMCIYVYVYDGQITNKKKTIPEIEKLLSLTHSFWFTSMMTTFDPRDSSPVSYGVVHIFHQPPGLCFFCTIANILDC